MRKRDDAKYRDMIVQNLDASMLVEAGAGSGKTTSLVDRMVALIAAGKCNVDKMAAVTFTRKAAAELKGRFQIALEDAFQEEQDGDKKVRYEAALSRLEHLFAGTIHSFCARLLRERPIEAKLDPGFEELEEDENFLLRDRCWAEYLDRLHTEGAPILQDVIELGLAEPAELLSTYRNVCLYPEVSVVRKKQDRPDFSKDRTLLKKYLTRVSKSFPKAVPEKGWDPLQDLIRRTQLGCRHLDLDRDQDFINVISGLHRSPVVTLYKWPSKEIAKEEKAGFDQFRQDVVAPCLERWRHYCHYFIIELVVPAVAYFGSVRDRDSLMNYQDLLVKSAELLRGNSEVRRYFQERFTHILVDEFQDTDPIQAEVILYVTGEALEEQSWRKLKVKPGALFIVGDPKQSIYRFRRADIDTYNEVKRIIDESGGVIIPLTANFRSLPPVCDWINPIFEKKFPAKADEYQPAFEPLEPHRKIQGGGVRRITIGKVPYHNQEVIAQTDAKWISSWIDWALKGNFEVFRTEEEEKEGKGPVPGPGDFMILTHYKAHLPIYARALEERGIPYEITGGGAFAESKELWHLLNLLTAVADSEDQVALVATLRGIFFGVSDDLLYRFKRGGGVFSYLAPSDKCGDKEARDRLERVFAELHEFHRWTRTKPPAGALSLILDRLGIVPLVLTREMGESRAGNLFKALELAFWESSRGTTTFVDLVERLSYYYQEVDVEGLSVEPGKKDVVKLMNLHKAKGLEATVVFLADPVKDVTHEPMIHITRKGKEAAGYFVAFRAKSEYASEVVGLPSDWSKYQALEEKYEAAESERLLYVASTRARQLLVVTMYPKKPDKGPWKDFYPYLQEVEELEAPEEVIVEIPKGEVSADAFETARNEIAERIGGSQERSYETESVTAAAKAETAGSPFSEDATGGMAWGRIIHRMLEAVTKDESIDLGLMAENALKEEEKPHSEKEAVIATVNAVMSSELWNRMKKAAEALVEVPFSLKVEEAAAPKVMSGVIDLAFKEEDGWVLADYKTDKVDGKLDAFVAYYKPQVDMYRKFWEEACGEKVKEAGLYFIDTAKWVTV